MGSGRKMFLCDLVDRREIVHSAKALPTCLNVHFLQQLFSWALRAEREMYELEHSRSSLYSSLKIIKKAMKKNPF